MEDVILNQVLKNSFTLSEALKNLQALKDLANQKIFSNLQVTLPSYLPADFFNNLNPSNFSESFTKAEEDLKKINPLVVYIAFEMPKESTDQLGQYLRESFGPNFLFETKFDPSLIAGCALVWNGVYHDYSLRKKMVEYRPQLLKMLQEYIK